MEGGAYARLDAFNAVHAQRKLPYYDILGVAGDATQSEIISAYRKLSLKYHPDKAGGSTEKFQELSKAYKCLKNEDTRRKYDDCGFDEDNISTTEVDEFVDAFFGEGARGVDGRSGDWRLHSVDNYVRIQIDEVPLHMRDIVRIGLQYIVSLDHQFHDVVLMQHNRVDILYLMVGVLVEGQLTQQIFESQDSYTITYYDNPLQPGITPMWSDQNVLGNKRLSAQKKKEVPRKELNWEEFQRRQKHALAMLENGPADPMVALEEKYRAKMLTTEHERRTRAIMSQDIYENDAELDCNEFSNFLSDQKKDKEREAAPGIANESPSSGHMETGDSELDNLLAVTEITRIQSADAERAVSMPDNKKLVTNYESYGTKDVLGCNSDGVLFVAKGGKVLRNVGPPKPAAAAQKPESKTSPKLSRSFPLTSCMCCPVFQMKATR
mmetsp:Transcript_101782/g.180484  ORF Transcript_101782/g.180484 Transcript_101782/m.180484 type:complete len:437 (+) Transcript_101782:54-1364(+)